MKNKLTYWILGGLVLGILAGHLAHTFFKDDSESLKQFIEYTSIGNFIFMRLIKLIIAPLVLGTLVVGVAGIGDAKTVGRMGAKTIGWFIGASLMSLTFGLILVNITEPGQMFLGQIPQTEGTLSASDFTLKHFMEQLIPENIVLSLSSHKTILQIALFSVFFGLALSSIGEKGEPLIKLMDSLAHAMLKLTNMIMWIAPLAVFSAVAVVIAERGVEVLSKYSYLILLFYLGLALLWALLLGICYLFIGKKTGSLISHIKEPLMLAFATASSESALPKLMNQLDRFGIKEKISSFVLPLGYSFNLDGSMMYMTFGSILIAQASGVDLTLSQQISMLLILMVTSKGIAGVPRASLVVIAATIANFNIPEAGLALLLPIDTFLDMGRSATNVVGNAVATVAVSRMEGEEIHH